MGKNHLLTTTFVVSSALAVLLGVLWHVLFSQTGPTDPRLQILQPQSSPEDDDNDATTCVLERKAPELLALFSEPDDWRRDANLIRFPDASLYFLFKGEPKLADDERQLTLQACTAVYLPRARRVPIDDPRATRAPDDAQEAPTLESETALESIESRAKRAIVFEVSDQITLNFSVSLMDVDRLRKEELSPSLLVGGRLHGQVVVRGGDETSDRDPTFYVQTRDVAFSTRQFRTAADVSFRFGPHYGTGEGLTIDFETPESFERRSKKPSAEEPPLDSEPLEAEAREDLERARVMRQIDEIVEDGSLGDGFSVRQIEINKLKDGIHFDLSALKDELGGVSSEQIDRLDVGCRGGLHFEPTAHAPGEWCVRFGSNVTAVAWRQSERVCVFKGKVVYLYFQDMLIDELRKTSVEAAAAIKRRVPLGALARLKATVVRVLGEEEPVTVEYTQTSEEAPPRVFRLKAMDAYYDDRLGDLKLFDRLETNPYDSGTPAPTSVSVTEYDRETGEPLVSTLTSPTVVVKFDKKEGLKLLETKGSGTLTSHMRANRRDRVEIQAFWEKGLQLEPRDSEVEGAYLLTSSGASRCVVEGLGSFYSTELNFWFRLSEKLRLGGSSKSGYAGELSDAPPSGAAKKEKFDVGFAPICAKFAKDVVMETARGSITVADSVVVRFSDQNGTETGLENVGAPPKTFASAETDEGRGLGGVSSALTANDGRFTLSCNRLDVSCALEPKTREDAGSAGKRMGLRVVQGTMYGGVSFVDCDANNVERASLYAETAVVENPMTSAMKLYFKGAEDGAKFHANELTLQGENVNIDVAQNSFQVAGAGDVTIQPPPAKAEVANSSGGSAPGTFDLSSVGGALRDPIAIAWTKAMVFDGQTMRFLANATDDVIVKTTDASIRCAETRLTLKLRVSLQDLKFSGDSAPDVDYVECFGAGLEKPARMSYASRAKTANPGVAGDYNGYYNVTCSSVRVAADTGVFTIESQGALAATILSEKGVAGLGEAATNAVAAPGSAQSSGAASGGGPEEKKWVRVSARFGGATGSLKDGTAEINGGVNALVCDVEGPSSPVSLGDSANWPEGALTFHSRRALYRSAGGGAAMKENVELEARGDVTFRVNDLSGYCESLGYAASKNLVTLSGAENALATIERQAYSGARRTKVAEFMTGRIRLDTKKFEVENLTVSENLDNLDSKFLKKKKDGGER